MNKNAVEIAREAAESFADGRHRWVIGDIGPGTKLPSLGNIAYDALEAALVEQCRGLVAGGGAVWALSEGYRLVRGQAGMGGGDVMLMGMVGAFLGPWAAAGVLAAGALLGTLYILVRTGGRLDGTAKLPFGTFLAVAAAVILVLGTRIWAWYSGFFA